MSGIMNFFRRKQQVSQTSLMSKNSGGNQSAASSNASKASSSSSVSASGAATLSASSNSSSGSGKTNEVIQQTMTSISPIGKKSSASNAAPLVAPSVSSALGVSAVTAGLIPIASSVPPSLTAPGHQAPVTFPSINNNNTASQRVTPSLFGASPAPAGTGFIGEMKPASSTTSVNRTKPTPPTSLFAAPSSSSSNANSKIIRDKMKGLKADLDSENSSQARGNTESAIPSLNTFSLGDKLSRPSALAPLSSSALPPSPSDFVMLGPPRTRTRIVDFRLGSEPAPNYARTNQLSSTTSSDSDKHANFSDFLNQTSSSHRSSQKFTPNGLHPLQLPTSSSRSSSTSSISYSLSSSSSSLPPSSYSTVCRLEAVNSEKFREILKNNGYLTINGERIKSTMSDLSPICELGRGTCGRVMKMKHVPSGTIMAVKQMSISGIQEENKRIIMDLDIAVKSHDCKEIVRCLGYYISESDVWICMELMSMCFDKLLKLQKAPIPEQILGKLTVSTLNALTYLKDVHHVIHRDVKPSNILIDENGEIKLCDFGISGNLINSNAHTRSNTGCAGYMAPERIEIDQSNPVYDIRADVWSLGISLVELATGEYPYKGCKNEFEVMSKIIETESPKLEGDQFSDNFKAFIDKCLIRDVRQRPKYNVLTQLPFVLKYKAEQVDVRTWFRSILAANNLLATNNENNNETDEKATHSDDVSLADTNSQSHVSGSDEVLQSGESSTTTPTVPA